MNKTTEALKRIRAILSEPDDEETISKIREALAEPVKEPVAHLCAGCIDNFPTGRYETCEATDYGAFPVYAAPVDAKAIRTEALEEAAKWLADSGLIGSNDCAAAIRRLK